MSQGAAQTPTPTPTPPAQELNAAGEVVFRIKAETGNQPWNTAADPIRLKKGQTLRVFNDDNANHTIHTNSTRNGYPNHGCTNRANARNIGQDGVACQFGENIQSGMLPDSQIHDHFTWVRGSTATGMVYILIED